MPRYAKHQVSRATKRKIKKKLEVLSFGHERVNHPAQTVPQLVSPTDLCQSISNSQCTQVRIQTESSEHSGPNETLDATLPIPLNSHNVSSELSRWALTNSIKGTSLSSLLKILQRHECFQDLPTDSRTFLRTPRTIPLKAINPGEYCHFGLQDNLNRILGGTTDIPSAVSLQCNVDGLPISKSSSQQFWPILLKVTELPNSAPFPIGIYFGNDKPKSSNEFLHSAVEDIIKCKEIVIDNKKLQVKLHSIVCDAPARSFVLNIKGHTGYFACHKCQIEGEYFKNRMTFPDLSCQPRTNLSFRNRHDEEHHVGPPSELVRLDIDIIKNVPLDYQHLVCLGVVRKLLNLWVKGGSKQYKLRSDSIHLLSRRLITIKSYFPKEFARKPRSLSHLKNWKATEYRTFLLYTGPHVVHDLLPKPYYDHFITLHCAITILCSKSLQRNFSDYAGNLLRYFVENFGNLYGKEHLSYNVHNLIHIAEDSKIYGPLDNFSTFEFENELGKLKRVIRSGNRPLEQAYNRITEKQRSVCFERKQQNRKEFELAASKSDNVCVLSNGALFQVFEIFKDANKYFMNGHILTPIDSLYEFPIASHKLGIVVCEKKESITNYPSDLVIGKGICYPKENSNKKSPQQYIVLPLLHSLPQ